MAAAVTLPAFAQDSELPERALWLGVLVQAIDDYHGRALRREPDAAMIRRDAEEFLFSAARRGDLELVCQAAGVDVDAVRDAVRRGDRPPRMRFIARRSAAR